jgi:methyltransferase (TIGR00027 family)
VKPDRPSQTALLIARSLAFSSGDPTLGELVLPESAELAWACITAASPSTLWLHRLLCKPGLRWLIRAAETAVLPGVQLHYLVRKRYLDDAARDALANGALQVVVFGAGFDALALRMDRLHRQLRCLEVDHPSTQAIKRAALGRYMTSEGAPPVAAPGNLRLIAADIARDPLLDTLHTGGYDPGLQTFFVAEGLTMYLDQNRVRAMLSICAANAPRGSRFAWTFMDRSADGSIAFREGERGYVDRWLRKRGEPFTWGIGQADLEAFTASLGLRLLDVAGEPELRRRYLEPRSIRQPLAAGEIACVVAKP